MAQMKMKELPKTERPRERLMIEGVEHLSNEELLAILFTSGTGTSSVKELAFSFLKTIGGISKLSDVHYEELIKINGIGPAKACILLSALELGKRVTQKELKSQKFQNAQLIFEYYQKKLESKKQEHFYCIYLDAQKKIIRDKLLFIGTLNQSLVHPREIFKEAYLLSASSIICIHNHPSGQLLPSKADYMLTKRLMEIGSLLGIPLNDHIIIGKDGYYSFYENHDIE